MSSSNSLTSGSENVKIDNSFESISKLHVPPPNIDFIKNKIEKGDQQKCEIRDMPCAEECYDIYIEFDRRLKESYKSISNRDMLVGVLQGQLKKMEDLYKANLDDMQLMRFKYYSTLQELNNLKKICDHLEFDNLRLAKYKQNGDEKNNMLKDEIARFACKCRTGSENKLASELKKKNKALEEENGKKIRDADNAEKDNIISKLKQEISKLNTSINDLKITNIQCDNNLEKSNGELSDLRQQNKQLLCRINEYKEDKVALKNQAHEISVLKSQLESLETICRQLEEELNKQTNQLQEKSKKYEEMISKLNVNKRCSSEDYENAQIMQNRDREIELLNKDVEILTAEKLSLEAEVTFLQTENRWLLSKLNNPDSSLHKNSSLVTEAGSLSTVHHFSGTTQTAHHPPCESEQIFDLHEMIASCDTNLNTEDRSHCSDYDNNSKTLEKLKNTYEQLKKEHDEQDMLLKSMHEELEREKEVIQLQVLHFESAQVELNALKTNLMQLETEKNNNLVTIKELQEKLEGYSAPLESHKMKDECICTLNAQIETLKEQCITMENDKTAVSKELDDLKNNLTVLSEQKDNKIKDLQDELELIKFNLVELQKLYENLQDQTNKTIEKCSTKMNESDNLLEILQKDNTNLREEIAKYETIAAEYELKMKTLQDDIDKLNERDDPDSLFRLRNAEIEITQLTEEMSEKNKNILDLQKEVDSLKGEMQTLQKDYTDLSEKYHEDLDHFSTQRAQLTVLNDESRKMCNDLCSNYNSKLNELQECRINLQKNTCTMQTLEKENSDLKTEIENLQKENSTLKQESGDFKSLQMENSSLKLKLEDNEAQIVKERGDNSALEEEITNLKSQLVEYDENKKLLEKREADLEEKSALMQQLEQQNLELQQKYVTIEQEVNEVKSKYENEINEIKLKNEQLLYTGCLGATKSEEKYDLENENSELKKEISALRETIQSLERDACNREEENSAGGAGCCLQFKKKLAEKYQVQIKQLQRDIAILVENYNNQIEILQEDLKKNEITFSEKIKKLEEENRSLPGEIVKKCSQEIRDKQQIIDTCHTVIEQNETTIVQLRMENSQLQDELQDCRNEVFLLQTSRGSKSSSVENTQSDALRDELECIARDRDSYIKALLETQNKIEYISTELNEKKREIENCESTMEQYDAKMDEMEKYIEEIKTSCEILKRENELLIKENKYLYEQLLVQNKKDVSTSCSSMVVPENETLAYTGKLQEENTNLKEQLETMCMENSVLKDKLEKICTENSENVNKISQLSQELEKLSETFCDHIESCSCQTNSLGDNLEIIKQKKQETDLNRTTFENEIVQLNAKIAEQAEEIKHLQKNSVPEQIVNTCGNMSSLKLEFEELEQNYEKHFEEWQNEMQKYQEELEETYNENENLKRQCDLLRSQVEILNTTMEQYKQDAQFRKQESLDLRKKESQLLKEMCCSYKPPQPSNCDVEEMKKMYNDLEQELNEKNNQVTRLQNKLLKLESTMPGCDLIEELMTIKNSYSRLKKEYDDLKVLYDDHLDMYRGEVFQLKSEENPDFNQTSVQDVRDAKDKKIAQLELNVKEEEIKVKIFEEDLKNKVGEIIELQDQCSKLTVSNNNLRLQIIEMENQMQGIMGMSGNFSPDDLQTELILEKPTNYMLCKRENCPKIDKASAVLFENAKYDEDKYSSEGSRVGIFNFPVDALPPIIDYVEEKEDDGSDRRITNVLRSSGISGVGQCFNIISDFVTTQEILQEKLASEIELKKECATLKEILKEKDTFIENATDKEGKKNSDVQVKAGVSKAVGGACCKQVVSKIRPPTRRDEFSMRGRGSSRSDRSPSKEIYMSMLNKKIKENTACPGMSKNHACPCLSKANDTLKSKYLI